MSYQQYRPLTKKLLNIVKSVIIKDFREYTEQKNKILDLFCGKGGFTIDVARYVPASYIVGVDTNISLLKSFGRYLDNKQIKHKMFCLDAFKFKFTIDFDVVLIDPPFQFNLCDKLLKSLHDKKMVSDNTLIIVRNLLSNVIELDTNIYFQFHNIIVGQNQLIFLKLQSKILEDSNKDLSDNSDESSKDGI